MATVPSHRPNIVPTLLSAGFRPFFLLAALWAFFVVPISVAVFAGAARIPTAFAPVVWHVHELVYGFGAAAVAGFLLTAIPNWTGRLPLQGGSLAVLVLLWALGRIAVLVSATIGAAGAAIVDLAFPAVFLVVVAREIVAGRNWRNLVMSAGLVLLLLGNLLVHLESVGVGDTAALGNRLGIATLFMLISIIGGRIIPSFTRNWLVRERPEVPVPAPFDVVDRMVLAVTALTLVVWTAAPEAAAAPWIELVAGIMVGLRLARWRGTATLGEPLLSVLHLGYGWMSLGFLLLAFGGFVPTLPRGAAVHALTVGAIGTMVLAVMTRASRGHTGRPLVADRGTTTIYLLVTLAAVLRLVAPLAGDWYLLALSCAGTAWSAAFGLFLLLYAPMLARSGARGKDAPRA